MTSLNGRNAADIAHGHRGKLRKFKQTQVVALTTALNARGARGPNGTYIYQPGYSDEAVRNEVDKDLSLDRVVEFRRGHFGRLQSEMKPTGGGRQLAARVAELEARITRIEALLETRLDPIADALLPKSDPGRQS
jgi:hypothetical protein